MEELKEETQLKILKRQVHHWDHKERLRRHAMKPRRCQWTGHLVRFKCGKCKRVYVHRSSLHRHKKQCKLDEVVWKRLKTDVAVHLGPEAPKTPLPKPPERRGRPPHILSYCQHSPKPQNCY